MYRVRMGKQLIFFLFFFDVTTHYLHFLSSYTLLKVYLCLLYLYFC